MNATLQNAADFYIRNALGDLSYSETSTTMNETARSLATSDHLGETTSAGGTSRTNISLLNVPSATPSPDEMVIKGRGRRSLPVKWSPIPVQSPQKPMESTPHLHARTGKSPRKRLQLNDISELEQSRKNLFMESPINRKLCPPPVPNVSASMDVFKNLSHEQLVNILNAIVIKHPEITDEVSSIIPLSDIKGMVEEVMNLRKEIYRSLPTSRLASKTDARAFCKAVPYIANLKEMIQQHCKLLCSNGLWELLIEYIFSAWPYIRALPKWDSEAHFNCSQKTCFKILSDSCLESLQKVSFTDKEFLASTMLQLEQCKADHKVINNCIIYLNKF